MTDSVLHIAGNRSIAEALVSSPGGWSMSPWPLASLYYSSVASSLSVAPATAKAILLLLALSLLGFALSRSQPEQFRPWKMLLALVFVPVLLGRDLARGVLPSGSDPYLTLVLWALFLIVFRLFRGSEAKGNRGDFIRISLLLLGWSLSDLSWPFAFALAFGVLILRAGRRACHWSAPLIPIVLLGVVLVLPFQGLDLLRVWQDALQSPADSAIRIITGWNSPNFQNRKEIVLALILLLVSGTVFCGPELLGLLSVVILTLTSEFGVVPLSVFAAQMLYYRFNADARFSLLAPLPIALGLMFILSRPEPYPYENVVREILPGVQTEKDRATQKDPATILADFRLGPALLARGQTPFLNQADLHALSQHSADYENVVKLDDRFRSLLDSHRIRFVLFPEDSPLANILTGLGSWRVIERTSPYPNTFRGNVRISPFVLLQRSEILAPRESE